MKRKRRITLRFHKPFTFVLLSAGFRQSAVCVVDSEKTYEDEELPYGFKEETLRKASRFGPPEWALATRR